MNKPFYVEVLQIIECLLWICPDSYKRDSV